MISKKGMGWRGFACVRAGACLGYVHQTSTILPARSPALTRPRTAATDDVSMERIAEVRADSMSGATGADVVALLGEMMSFFDGNATYAVCYGCIFPFDFYLPPPLHFTCQPNPTPLTFPFARPLCWRQRPSDGLFCLDVLGG